jgi:16S rRNA (cytosine967-C5)-methyltransferase
MKTESLLGLALELVDELASPGALPADARVGRFFRQRRYLGSRDRRVLGDAAYAWLRHVFRARSRWDAWAASGERSSISTLHPRLARLAESLALARDGLWPWSFEETLESAGRLRFPQELAEAPGGEAAATEEDATAFWLPVIAMVSTGFLDEESWPADALEKHAAEWSLPVWLAQRLIEEQGEETAARLARALSRQATVDLRVNLRRASRESVRRGLEEELGIPVELTPLSPFGLRLEGRKNLTATKASRKGLIEVADEGTQLVVACLEAEPGSVVVDACAGAGGKSLALADCLDVAFRGDQQVAQLPRGKVVACETDTAKLDELLRRAEEAGVADGIVTVPIAAEGRLPSTVPQADLVLVDAPCTGLGTLRRSPELKSRYTGADVARFAAQGGQILARFADRVKPGGRIAYVTCSLLEEENEGVAAAFTRDHPEFEPAPSAWAAARLSPRCLQENFVRLDPLRSQTDGFFLAMWRRVR